MYRLSFKWRWDQKLFGKNYTKLEYYYLSDFLKNSVLKSCLNCSALKKITFCAFFIKVVSYCL